MLLPLLFAIMGVLLFTMGYCAGRVHAAKQVLAILDEEEEEP